MLPSKKQNVLQLGKQNVLQLGAQKTPEQPVAEAPRKPPEVRATKCGFGLRRGEFIQKEQLRQFALACLCSPWYAIME